jgi:pyruvate formate lyase activating enzyme
MMGTIFDVKEMSLHDGPGIRTSVFFKGCPLRCAWCHNPEGLVKNPQLMYNKVKCRGCGLCQVACSHPECAPHGRCLRSCPENALEIAGRKINAKDLKEELLPTARLLGDTFGGFTFTGGEPLFQPEFLLALMEELRGFHLCIETSGFAEEGVFSKVIAGLDFVIMDLKLYDGDLHKKYTGQSNGKILKNYEILRKSGKPYIIRTPLIPGITDTEENLSAIEKLIEGDRWEKIPYNSLWRAKYPMLEGYEEKGDLLDE